MVGKKSFSAALLIQSHFQPDDSVCGMTIPWPAAMTRLDERPLEDLVDFTAYYLNKAMSI
jgi:hypothetical protein